MSAEASIEPQSRKPFPKEQAQEGEIGFVEMTKSCARDLTDRIRTAGEEFATLLYRAHEGRAWQPLGYGSWKEYCQAEFQLKERRSYQLLDFVEIKLSLKDCTKVQSPQNEVQTRALKAAPVEKRAEVWERTVEITNGEQPTAKQVAAVVEGLEREPVEMVISEVAPSEGMRLVEQAIRILSKIAANDTQRGKAFRELEAWINLHKPR